MRIITGRSPSGEQRRDTHRDVSTAFGAETTAGISLMKTTSFGSRPSTRQRADACASCSVWTRARMPAVLPIAKRAAGFECLMARRLHDERRRRPARRPSVPRRRRPASIPLALRRAAVAPHRLTQNRRRSTSARAVRSGSHSAEVAPCRSARWREHVALHGRVRAAWPETLKGP